MEITRISLTMPLGMGQVNCYLLRGSDGYVMLDTGPATQRRALERALEQAGCRPGDLSLIALTHGDFDHTGNAAYLRTRFESPVAMHRGDAGMLERGDMFWNRRRGNALVRALAPRLIGFGRAERIAPDRLLEDGDSLARYGLAAPVLHLPGHSSGSIGILAADGALFCGDLLENRRGPAIGSIVDDPQAAQASLDRLAGLKIGTVYPGHGEPFLMAALVERLATD